HDSPAAGLVDDVHAVVLPVGTRHAEEHREPAPEAEPALPRQPPVEDELVALAAEVAPRLLEDAVHEDLERVAYAGREFHARPFSHRSRGYSCRDRNRIAPITPRQTVTPAKPARPLRSASQAPP